MHRNPSHACRIFFVVLSLLSATAFVLGLGVMLYGALFGDTDHPSIHGLYTMTAIVALILVGGWVTWAVAARKRWKQGLSNNYDAGYRAIVESIGSAIYTIDHSGRVGFWNRGARRSFGFSRDEAIGSPPPHVPPERVEELKQILTEAEEGAEVNPRVTQRITKGGRRVDVGIAAAPLDGRGGGDGVVCVIETDVTAQSEMERALRRSERLAGIGQLAAGMAHELNTPLGTILLSTDVVRASIGGGAADELDTIETEARRCQETIRRLLAFSRGAVEQRQPVDLNRIVERCAALWRRQLDERGILLETHLPEPCVAEVDGHQLEEVIFNLLANSAHATPSKGRVTIASSVQDNTVTLSIQDTGSGIPSAIVDKIFDPFFTTKPPDKGTGLGLYICDQILASHRGSIAVDSKPGIGSAFRITLPRFTVRGIAPASGSRK